MKGEQIVLDLHHLTGVTGQQKIHTLQSESQDVAHSLY